MSILRRIYLVNSDFIPFNLFRAILFTKIYFLILFSVCFLLNIF
ncbi:unnamed protein product [Meloidogyne enterolobii]|uniref:Uncharacterized protein n=1 Tax=Meloidogyne enterolobii TaxID=390850 RepID=A0ACB0XQE0_MELEN